VTTSNRPVAGGNRFEPHPPLPSVRSRRRSGSSGTVPLYEKEQLEELLRDRSDDSELGVWGARPAWRLIRCRSSHAIDGSCSGHSSRAIRRARGPFRVTTEWTAQAHGICSACSSSFAFAMTGMGFGLGIALGGHRA